MECNTTAISSLPSRLADAATQYLGKDFTYFVKMNSDTDWRQIGLFTLTTAELPDKQTAKIEGFDYIYKFDVIVDEWLDSLTFPMTLGNFFNSNLIDKD